MIKSFIFENFKSFNKAEFNLESLTILIGSNASGKSNAIEGIRILSEISTGREFSVILDGSKNVDSDIRGGSRGCPKFNSNFFKLGCIVDLDNESDLEYSIKIKVGDRIYVDEESLYKVFNDDTKELVFKTKKTSKDSGDIKVEYNNGKPGKNPDLTCIRSSSVLAQLSSKIPSESEKFQEDINNIDLVIKNLRNMLFLNPVPSEMRDYSRINDSEMRSKADNLSSVLYKLCQDDNNKKRILDVIGTLPENEILDIDFIKTPIGDVMFRLKEKFSVSTDYIEAKRLSDGTIRCIAVIASLISEKSGSVVIIEEVDNGIHPSRAKSLINTISSLCKERSIDVIITTHNPALLNAVTKDDLIGVTICYRDENDGSSKFIQFIDINKYPELLAQGSLGDLAVNNEILNTIKGNRRRKKDFNWLGV
ncbi:Predicted ATPase [Caloramator quimbayensis]|uniref:Predicted ATPase n=1 Tax=Caloramator quimbayensis TaxID=1147123 RepID=A0A1T4XPW2_9CLOT|nr:ATP-binding protein [Caloramator quimbayensis]SKA91592.1 Predicted ATPase [Caloramator quimbayensis]